VESGERAVVGVNCYESEEQPASISRPDPAEREQVLSDLRAVRAERDAGAVEAALAVVERAARGGENVMPSLVAAVGVYATIGELSTVFTGVFGEHRSGEGF
jgi:methylmalonyl-CoA mutase N-terminal domain/subunit